MGNGLNHFMGDLYPNMGFSNSRYLSIPEADDQHTLVDNEEQAKEHQVKHSPADSKKILLAIGLFLLVFVLLSVKF